MTYCSKCSTTIGDGVKFCPACGEAVEIKPASPENVQNEKEDPIGEKFRQLNDTKDETEGFDKTDIETNKAMAVLAYLGLLALIPLIAARKSPYARYHTNQGLVLLIAEMAYSILYGILNSILLAISWRLAFIASILGFASIVFLVIALVGIINALNGRAKELPVIGKFKILK